jgi:hypothetical protein
MKEMTPRLVLADTYTSIAGHGSRAV